MSANGWMNSNWGGYGDEQVLADLNHAAPIDEGFDDIRPHARPVGAEDARASVEVVFQGIEDRLCYFIQEYDAIFGCVAWLTNRRILRALHKKLAVGIVVQKEDWLRPDSGAWSKETLMALYTQLPEGDRPSLGMHYNIGGDLTLPPIMCAGFCPETKQSALPRMHHKFLVGCVPGTDTWIPKAVWTGSFNLTDNATRSIENAVIINSPSLASVYLEEVVALYGIAEPLNWNSRWVRPEFRIGT